MGRIKPFGKRMDYLAALVVLIILNFLLPRMMPGDPVDAIIGDQNFFEVTSEMKAELSAKLGLDKPLHHQFLVYLANLCRLDFGYSYYYNESVTSLILGYLPWTLLLASTALLISLFIGFYLGIECGYRHDGPLDRGVLSGMMLVSGMPHFFVGMLLIVFFACFLNWFPMQGCETAGSSYTGFPWLLDICSHMVLPVTAIVAGEVVGIFLLVRNTSLLVQKKPFITTARAKGLRPSVIKYRYIGRNSFVPLFTVTGMMLGRMFAGIILVEVVFSYPGLGTLIYNAVAVRDYPVLQGSFFFIAIMVLLFNSLAETFNQKYTGNR